MVDGRMVLQGEELGDADRARAAHPREVVPQQIHDHHVLGAVLLALGQGAAQRGVVHGTEPAGAGSLDRPGLHVAAVFIEAEKPLGRGAHHLQPVEAQVRGKGRGIPAAEPPIQLERRLPERGLEALGQVRLEDVARDDVLAHPGHGVQVSAVSEGGAKLDRLGTLDPGHGVRRRGRAFERPVAPPWPFLERVGSAASRLRAAARRSAARRCLDSPSAGAPVETSHAAPIRWSQAITQS